MNTGQIVQGYTNDAWVFGVDFHGTFYTPGCRNLLQIQTVHFWGDCHFAD